MNYIVPTYVDFEINRKHVKRMHSARQRLNQGRLSVGDGNTSNFGSMRDVMAKACRQAKSPESGQNRLENHI